jgi:hypothetical protein
MSDDQRVFTDDPEQRQHMRDFWYNNGREPGGKLLNSARKAILELYDENAALRAERDALRDVVQRLVKAGAALQGQAYAYKPGDDDWVVDGEDFRNLQDALDAAQDTEDSEP